jgi:hypothetical protein
VSFSANSTLSWTLFHEPWWLDAVAPSGWEEVRVEDNGNLLARLPYVIRKRVGFVGIGMPPMTRTLGPQLIGIDDDSPVASRYRIECARTLFAKLPPHDYFYQLCDPAMREALCCHLLGFESRLDYTFRIAPGAGLDKAWSESEKRIRQNIRKASQQVTIDMSLDIDEFSRFHDNNLIDIHDTEPSTRDPREKTLLRRRIYEVGLKKNALRVIGAREPDGRLAAAVMVVWGHGVMYYFQTTRSVSAPSGAVPYLIWETIKLAAAMGLCYDFDSFRALDAGKFLAGFSGRVEPRIALTHQTKMARILRSMAGR